MYEVTFLVLESGERVTRTFKNYLECKRFCKKLRYSKKCALISYPLFED